MGSAHLARSISVRHNFEAGHRLPHQPGKCTSLHGHSFWCKVTVSAPELDDRGMVVEYASFKAGLRNWIDQTWDHGLILGDGDPLCDLLMPYGKVYRLPTWPTVEALAEHLAAAAGWVLTNCQSADGAIVSKVRVRETHVNDATWRADLTW